MIDHSSTQPSISDLFGQSKPWALGRNQHSAELAQHIPLAGFVDDYAEAGCQWQDLPVLHADQLSAGVSVINCSMSIGPVNAHQRLSQIPGLRIIPYYELLAQHPSQVPVPDFVADTRQEYDSHRATWDTIANSFADQISRTTFQNILHYRLYADYSAMLDYTVRIKDQYFEPFYHLTEGSVFVDCGGFDGETSEIFAQHYPNYGAIHLFEPSAANMALAHHRLSSLHNVHEHQFGVSSENGEAYFDADSGSASAISASGERKILLRRLDDCIAGRVDLIKMDLEGCELDALKGARNLIIEQHPVLAIAVYHRASDFRTIWKYLRELNPEYSVYLRHYTQGWSETVMYFIP